MDPSKRIPLWLHIVRISVLTAAVVAVAWVVLSAQRRAMRARAAALETEMAGADDALPAAPEFALPVAEDELVMAETAHVLPTGVRPSLGPPTDSRIFVPVVLADAEASELPPLTLEVPSDPVLRVPEFRLESPVDPYIGSSKSMVITPRMVRPDQSHPRHGKP